MSGTGEEGFDNAYSICGFLGGLVFALSLLPQIWKTFSTKSAGDLSYFWQFTYLVGLSMLGVNCIAYNLWPMLGPGIGDFTLMVVLTGMKYYYDNVHPRKNKLTVKEVDVNGTISSKPVGTCVSRGDIEVGKAQDPGYGGGKMGKDGDSEPLTGEEAVVQEAVVLEESGADQDKDCSALRGSTFLA